ncbi:MULTISPECIES: type VII secretion-associated serine protease mycosin [Micromonospora]|uniref:Type VII secretion-associated serine protease mycosin n=1 Tax=Micromonospora solifontis TaxID=2487138 RepID=A0ABX9WQ26_9ACTN|nr:MULTISPECIES: type VII secretion-associated serine protease mycosin [Micromonospora]NES13290.1 type VII secretion-associated serine protease mycosin [Micromonospora sp. PPF5-17B]NES34659.1 type VII secretion-associated serine protease mycosin [Micromonospora solifontis]NES57175.1 type VII secretion-associated serine protease mycosin [Micromonospora sp. PPF5-6]RNM01901.1 type VII secretion-associated serine protease mycosin [Micromonospora solifontis]
MFRPTAHPVLAALVTIVAAAVPAAPAAARAPSGCASPPAPARPVAATPWPQQRYAPDRLSPLADGTGVVVAVIDSGVDRTHPQLAGRVLDGADFLDRGGDGTRDCAGHGTGVASIIAARSRPGVAFRGLAPGARILPVRVSEQQVVEGRESGRTVGAAGFARAVRWAVDHDADVLNLSVVLYADDPAVRDAIAYAVRRDVVVVAAVGNLHDGGDPRPYPAAYDGVLGVGAIGADGTRAPFSQTGPYVDLVAPGSDVLMAAPGQGHQRAEGTSYATPFVAATAALLRQYRPELSAAEVAGRIVAGTDPAPGRGDGYGAGVLNPYRAVVESPGPVAARPEQRAALAVERPDPAGAAQRTRRLAARDRALLVAGVTGAAATVVALLAVVLPRGARRRWRPADPA